MRFVLKLLFRISLVFGLLLLGGPPSIFSETSSTAPDASSSRLSLDDIIASMEARYGQKGFSASFFQTSTLKVLDVTDSASGRLFIKRPGRMRWEYATPEKQLIVSNGETLWIHRPEDNQVMIGKAPAFFNGGRGAGFLSDITQIRNHFIIDLATKGESLEYILNLAPKESTDEVKLVVLAVSKETFDVVRVTTYNAYDDETQLVFSDLQFHDQLDDALFNFSPPENAEILELGEQ